jgi:hypothetical protein
MASRRSAMLDSQTNSAFAALLRALRKSSLSCHSRFVVRRHERESAFHGLLRGCPRADVSMAPRVDRWDTRWCDGVTNDGDCQSTKRTKQVAPFVDELGAALFRSTLGEGSTESLSEAICDVN